MHLSLRSKLGVLFSLVAIATLVSAFMFSVIYRGHAAQAAGADTSTSTIFHGKQGTGTLSSNGGINLGPGGQVPTGAKSPKLSTLPHVNADGHADADPAVASQDMPQADGTQLSLGAGKLLHNFNGLGNFNNAVDTGFVFIPPDQGLCVGNLGGVKVTGEMINTVLTFYKPDGTEFNGEATLNAFFDEPETANGGFTSDPRCYFDQATNTWFFTIVSGDTTNATATGLASTRIDIAVINAATQVKTVFKFDTTDLNVPSCAALSGCLGDQPHLGINHNNVYVTVDDFDLGQGNTFFGADLFVISKSQLEAGAANPHFVEFEHLSLGGNPIVTLQPAFTNSFSPVEWLLNSFVVSDANFDPIAADHRLGLWAFKDEQNIFAANSDPELIATVIQSEPYAQPVIAPSTAEALNPDDDRMQQVQFSEGRLWAALSTGFTVHGTTTEVDAAAWFEITPILAGHSIFAFTRQGYVASAGNYLVYPAIEHAFGGTTALVFTITNPTLNPSAAYTVRSAIQPKFGPIQIAAQGADGYHQELFDAFGLRWGDYSWASLDPNGKDLWLATEYIPPATALPPQFGNWGTRVFEVSGGLV